MYLFKFLAHSVWLTPMVMLRMFPVIVITFFLVGVVIYVLAPYPIALGLVMFLITWPLLILLGISSVRAALTQMRETTGPDLGKLFRKTIQLSLFHAVIALFFSMLTWVVAASLVPENWREALIDNLGVDSSQRAPVSFPTIDNRRSNRESNRPGVFSNRGLDDINPGGVERFERPPRPAARPDGETAGTEQDETAEAAEAEIQEEITSVVVEGVDATEPGLRSHFAFIFNFFGPLIIGVYGVQALYWIVLAALTVPFASQASTIASSGPKHEFLWGTGKKMVPIFILMVLTNGLQFVGFIALNYSFGSSLTLAAQELETAGSGLQTFLRSGGYYIGSILLLSFFTYSWMASGAAVAYIDSRADMQRKKDIELGRILASAEKGPDIRALIKARKKKGAMAEIAEEEAAADHPPAIRPAEPDESTEREFSPMVSSMDADDSPGTADAPEAPAEPPDADAPLQLSFDDEEPPEDYDEDWFLKPLPGEEGYEPPEEEDTEEDEDSAASALAARIEAAQSAAASPPADDPASQEVSEPEADPPLTLVEEKGASPSQADEDEEEDEDLEWVRKLFREGDTADERKG